MKRDKHKKIRGFTLIEMCIAMVLFSILLEMLGTFYLQIYKDDIQFNKQMQLINEANNVEAFIKNCIREAEEIRLITVEGEVINVGEMPSSKKNKDVVDQTLDKIEFTREIKGKDGSYQRKRCSLCVNSQKVDIEVKGKYKLAYRVWNGGILSSNTVSENIESIKVTHYENSNFVEFACKLQQENQEGSQLSYTKTFMESLNYKKYYKE